MTTVTPPAPGTARRWTIRLALLGLVILTAPVWGPVLLMFAIAGLDELAQKTTISERTPGTMPLVAPGREAVVITTGGPCYFCASGSRGMSGWGSGRSTRIPMHMIDREALALLPETDRPRRVQVVALEPMVVLVRDAPSEAPPEAGFGHAEGYLVIHGGRKRLWYGTALPGPMAGLSWASPGVAPTSVVMAGERQAFVPLAKGRLVLSEADGIITVTRE